MVKYCRLFLFAIIIGTFFLSFAGIACAGFGITPPYVQSDRLTRGSFYQQKILLVRNNPVDDLKVEITTSIPDVAKWFSIDPGKEFIFKKGEKQIPIIVSVNVPEDAEYGNYTGAIRVRTSPLEVSEGGGVSIALGAQIDVDITVVDKILDFEVKKIRSLDLEEGHKKWGLFFPAKIRLFMRIENTGNAKFGPTGVKLEIFDFITRDLLETTYSTNKIRQIEPFATEEVLAELPTHLKAGRYLAKYTIFKGEEKIAKQGEFNLSISTLGSIPGYEGYGFWGLSWKDKFKVFGVIGGIVLILTALIVLAIKRRRKRKKLATRD